jgi:hypothetical protein
VPAGAAPQAGRRIAGRRGTRAAALDRGLPDSPPVESWSDAYTIVPRGGAAAFLAPLPITLLPIDPEVARMLRRARVRTLGDFATLPPPSSAHRAPRDADLRAMARGEGASVLRSFAPSEIVRERVVCEQPLLTAFSAAGSAAEPLSFLLRPLVDRACERLRGRGMAAGALELRLGSASQQRVIPVELSWGSIHGTNLLSALRAALGRAPVQVAGPITELELVITREVEPAEEELALFGHAGAAAPPSTIEAAIANARASCSRQTGVAASGNAALLPLLPLPEGTRHKRAKPGKRRYRRTRRRDLSLPL